VKFLPILSEHSFCTIELCLQFRKDDYPGIKNGADPAGTCSRNPGVAILLVDDRDHILGSGRDEAEAGQQVGPAEANKAAHAIKMPGGQFNQLIHVKLLRIEEERYLVIVEDYRDAEDLSMQAGGRGEETAVKIKQKE
jgi:hypothetical protein